MDKYPSYPIPWRNNSKTLYTVPQRDARKTEPQMFKAGRPLIDRDELDFLPSLAPFPPPTQQEVRVGDLPGGLVVKNLSSCVGDVGLILVQRTKTPHAGEQLNLNAINTEPTC